MIFVLVDRILDRKFGTVFFYNLASEMIKVINKSTEIYCFLNFIICVRLRACVCVRVCVRVCVGGHAISVVLKFV